jgi:hypothetical protein
MYKLICIISLSLFLFSGCGRKPDIDTVNSLIIQKELNSLIYDCPSKENGVEVNIEHINNWKQEEDKTKRSVHIFVYNLILKYKEDCKPKKETLAESVFYYGIKKYKMNKKEGELPDNPFDKFIDELESRYPKAGDIEHYNNQAVCLVKKGKLWYTIDDTECERLRKMY